MEAAAGGVALTDRDRNALVARLRASRVAAGWADEVHHGGAGTIADLVAAAEAVANGRAQGGQARAVARVALGVFVAYAHGGLEAGVATPTTAAASPGAAPSPSRERLERGRAERLARRRARAVERHGGSLEDIDGLITALALMGEGGAEDDLCRLARRHVGSGFLLPPEVEGLVRRRVEDGALDPLPAPELDAVRVALLRYAVAGLRRSARDVAYALIERWDREGQLRPDLRQLAESLLWEARNDRA